MLILLLSVVQTAAADDGIRMSGCRRGVVLPPKNARRSPTDSRLVGGDFYHGNRRQMVVLASFRDRPFQDDEATTIAKWDKIFNTENFDEGSFVGSIHDYFLAQSYGQFNLSFDFYFVNLPDSVYKYKSTATDDENSQYMVDDIVDILQKEDIDWSLYDWNGDGYVNQLLILYAGKGMNNGGGDNSIWPHQWWLSMHLDQTVTDKEVNRNYRTVTSEGKQYIIDCYCCLQEMSNSASSTTFGTICHEYSHCFGFPDFYSYRSEYVGKWDLMDYGNMNGNGYCPPNYSSHERWLMGWCTPVELTSDTTVTGMAALCDEPQAYLIRNDGYANEYYMIENRQKRGWDLHLPGSGLVIFHVDFNESLWVSIYEYVNTGALRHYSIIPADNKFSLLFNNGSGWGYPYQGNDSLTNYSVPAATLNNANTDGSKLMNKSLMNMNVTDGLASFTFTNDDGAGSAIQSATVDSQQPMEVLYRIGSINIIRNARGEIFKVFTKSQ